MELWVRSQDKTALVKAGVIYIYNKKEIVCSSDYSITELGKYKTQKRALEVLDEIQSFINREDTLESSFSQYDIAIKSTKITCNVYEMPKD